jgi:hypothetical protein
VRFTFALLTISGSLAALPAFAQSEAEPVANRAPSKKASPAPRTPDGKVDFSGVWSPEHTFIYDISVSLKKGETLPLQPWAAELTQKRLSKDDPEANCLPTGVPRQNPYPWRIVQIPGYIYILFEGNIHSYRQIFMDGRKHPADPDPTWYGHSIGSFDGDTLTIDSVGFNDKFWFDFAGHPHTEQLHVVERFHRPDLTHLDYEATINDPGAYTAPFTMYGHSNLQEGVDLQEYICNENNQDVPHIVGKDTRK